MAARWIRVGVGKRALDLLVAVPLAVMLLPVTAVVAIAVRATMGTPVTFVQRRAGHHAKPVDVVKFRSMTSAVDSNGVLLPDVERLTAFGRRLRSTSLDELPQFWSVIKGDMSIVGPRPLPMVYVDRYDEQQVRRLEAKPGITGWAQVHGRNATSWPERLAMDVWYVDHASLRLDVRILVRTVLTVVRRDGVAADGHVTMPEFTGQE